MRLFELQKRPTYYLSSNTKLSVGDEHDRTGSSFPIGAAREGRLEAVRPANCLPRSHSFYLRTDGGRGDYIYEVEPVGQVDVHHTGWLEKLKVIELRNTGELNQLAQGYWSGSAYLNVQNDTWEHRALRVRVIKHV